MNRSMLISLAGLAIAIALVAKGQSTRSMQPDVISPAKTSTGFDPAQSVALFVGARTFAVDSTLETVPYAVDDAVDLAYTFALDPRVALVRPKRVVLALSGPAPSKPDSRRRLAELKKQGAAVVSADQSQILNLLNRQAGSVGPNGIFIVSFATHGFSDDGAQYLLAANSLLRERHTAIPAARIFDLVAQSNATRSLILIDACRERIQRKRAGEPEQLSAAPLMKRMALTEGQVVLYAAAAGKWAYDDDLRRNGVFTGAVLDGLQCRTGHDGNGLVTVDALSATVEQSVLSWIRTNRDLSIRNATQVSIDGAARTMPVAICSRPAPKLPEGGDPLVSGPLDPLANRRPLRQPLEDCQTDGKSLLRLYPSREPERFVRDYLGWRDGCVSVLRDLDRRLPQGKTRESETVRFLSIANFWCATKCPETLSAGNCAMFQEKSRAERCFWDLDKATEEVDAIIVRNASALKSP